MAIYVGEYDESRVPAADQQYWGRRVTCVKLEPLAADADDELGTLIAPCKLQIVSVALVDVDDDRVADGSDCRSFTLTNRGDDGSGETLIASRTTDTPTTDDITQFVPWPLVLASDPADQIVERGEVLNLNSVHEGNGLAQGEGLVAVIWRPIRNR
jgi:hypothetical protein